METAQQSTEAAGLVEGETDSLDMGTLHPGQHAVTAFADLHHVLPVGRSQGRLDGQTLTGKARQNLEIPVHPRQRNVDDLLDRVAGTGRVETPVSVHEPVGQEPPAHNLAESERTREHREGGVQSLVRGRIGHPAHDTGIPPVHAEPSADTHA